MARLLGRLTRSSVLLYCQVATGSVADELASRNSRWISPFEAHVIDVHVSTWLLLLMMVLCIAVTFVDVFECLFLNFSAALFLVCCLQLTPGDYSPFSNDSLTLIFGCSYYLLWQRLCLIVLKLFSLFLTSIQRCPLCLLPSIIFQHP